MFSHIFVLVCVFFWLTLKCQKRWGEWWVDLGQIWRKKHKWFSIYDWPWFLPTNTLKLEVRFEVAYLKTHSEACEHGKYIPIGSMYAIYGNIYHQSTPNVSIYTIHGSYGIYIYIQQMGMSHDKWLLGWYGRVCGFFLDGALGHGSNVFFSIGDISPTKM